MILLYALIVIVILTFIYFLFAPLYIEVNSIEGIYRLRLHRLASLSFFIEDDPNQVELKFMFWKKRMNLKNMNHQKKETLLEKEKKSKRNLSLKGIINVIKSFSVKRFFLTTDFGDMQVNGIMYPIFYWLSIKSQKNISINFVGKNIIVFEIENNLARMGRAYFAHNA